MEKYTIKNHDGIYAEMYGRKTIKDISYIIFIKKEQLKTTKQNDAFLYFWGWPGPDYNLYYFKDYGKSWAWTKEELIKNLSKELLSDTEKQHYINYYNCQSGRPYPCSNQIVICGIITHTQEQAIDYMNTYPEYQLIRQSHNQLIWINQMTNQKWIWVHPNVNTRGYRFYKVKISSMIEKNEFYERILPYCALYCCSMEFI